MKNPVNVDGDLDEWTEVPRVPVSGEIFTERLYDGPADLSGSFSTAWDSNFFYLSAVVYDDVFYQPYDNKNIWIGDAFQFALSKTRHIHISQDPAAGSFGGDNYEYGLALGPQGPVAWRWISGDRKVPTGKAEKVKLAVVKEKGSVTYEAAIPWSELAPIVPRLGEPI